MTDSTPNNSIFALIDANNFFVSCERLFDPKLRNKPVVVLSNNDGNVISRSQQAKDLGIPMAAPLFQYKQLIKDNNVAVFSSNYQLYGDISQRIMRCLRFFTPDIEVYSIDEAFLRLDTVVKAEEAFEFAKTICQKVEQWVGIPLSIGLGETKTLAKLANYLAKKNRNSKVFDLRGETVKQELLHSISVGEIWGVGKRIGKNLNILGINTVAELKDSDSKMIRSKFSVVMERTVFELRGISCLGLEEMQPRKNIMSSRSFGSPVKDLQHLEEAVSQYTAKAAVKLRGQKSKAQALVVFIRTNRFRENELQYFPSTIVSFIAPTNDTRELTRAAKEGLAKIYKEGYNYKKAGIILLDLISQEEGQQNFFVNKQNVQKSQTLMSTIDKINTSFGKETVFMASCGVNRGWQMKANMRSNRFTTNWKELCLVS